MDTKTITAQTKKAVAIGLCASLVGGVAAPVLSTTHVAYAAVAGKPQVNTMHDSVIQFKDPVFKKRVLSEMKTQGIISSDKQDITGEDALKVKVLNLGKHENDDPITSLDGIEKFKNLTTLWLSNNQISDITPLKDLTNLTWLYLDSNNISDLTRLAALTNLETLWLSSNQISDLTRLAGLTNLTTLDLHDNQISDITPLKDLTNLTWLYLNHNQIQNLECLNTLKSGIVATKQKISLHPTAATVDLKKEIKGFGDVTFLDENIVNGVLIYKEEMKNPCQIIVSERNGNHKYSATISVDFSNANKGTKTQTEDISEELKTLLDEYNAAKVTDNYKNADDNLKQAYDTAITDGQKVYEKLSSTHDQVQQACKQIKAAFGKLNGDAKTSATASQLQNRIQELEQQLENAKQQGVADKATIERLSGQVASLSSQLDALKADKTRSDQEKQREIEQLTAQLRDLTSQVNVLTNEKRTLQQQLDAATGKVSALTSEFEQLKAAKKQADEKNEQTITGLNAQVAQLTKDKQGLQDQINTKQTEINKLQGQIQALKDDHSKSDTEKLKKIEQLTTQLATLTQEKQDLQGKLDADNEKISTLTQQLQQAQSRADADTKQLQELTHALQQAKQQLEQLKSDKTKSDEQKQQEIDTLNAKIAELEKKVQTCSAQAVGGAIVAPLVNEKPTFDIEKYKREHNYMLPGSASYTYQTKQDTFTSDVHAALQQFVPMAASTNAAAQATAQRTDESERAQAEQKADTSSKQEADKTKLDQNKFPQTGDNSLLTLLSTFAGALVLVLGCFARKKSSKANKR